MYLIVITFSSLLALKGRNIPTMYRMSLKTEADLKHDKDLLQQL